MGSAVRERAGGSVNTVAHKPLTPRLSMRVSRFAMANYSAFYTATYLTRRDDALIEARCTDVVELRERAVFEAKFNHRNYLRCLREAKREGLMA